jgi:hypothetical protein
VKSFAIILFCSISELSLISSNFLTRNSLQVPVSTEHCMSLGISAFSALKYVSISVGSIVSEIKDSRRLIIFSILSAQVVSKNCSKAIIVLTFSVSSDQFSCNF